MDNEAKAALDSLFTSQPKPNNDEAKAALEMALSGKYSASGDVRDEISNVGQQLLSEGVPRAQVEAMMRGGQSVDPNASEAAQAAKVNALRRSGVYQRRSADESRNLGRAAAFAQGVGFETMDEVQGALQPEGFLRDVAVDETRQLVDDLPLGERLALQIGGAVTTLAIPGANLLNTGSTMAKTGKVAATGGGTGLFAGTAAGEGDVLEGETGRLESGTYGLVTGAIAAPVFGMALPHVASAVVKKVKGAAGTMTAAERTVYNRVADALKKDGLAPEDAAQALRQWQEEGGKPAVLLDVGGDHLAALAKDFAQNPASYGTAKAFVSTRNADQKGRINKDLMELLANGAAFAPTKRALAEARSAEGRAMFDKAWNTASDFAPDHVDTINGILQTPFGEKAITKARSLAANAQEDFTSLPEIKQLHYIKMGMDDLAYGAKKADSSIGRSEIGQMKAMTARLRRAMGRGNPAYDQASRRFGSSIEIENAADLGQDLFKMRPDDVEFEVAGMSEAAREGFRMGVANAILDKISRAQDGANVVRRFFTTDHWRDLLRPAFETDAQFQRFTTQMKREVTMRARGDDLVGGSPTSRLREGQAALGERTPLMDFAETGLNLERPVHGLRQAVKDLGATRLNDRISEVGTPFVLSGNPNSLAAAMARRDDLMNSKMINPLLLGTMAGQLSN